MWIAKVNKWFNGEKWQLPQSTRTHARTICVCARGFVFQLVTYVHISALYTLNHHHLCVFIKPVAVLRFVILTPTLDLSISPSLSMLLAQSHWQCLWNENHLNHCGNSSFLCLLLLLFSVSVLHIVVKAFTTTLIIIRVHTVYERSSYAALCEHFTHHMLH